MKRNHVLIGAVVTILLLATGLAYAQGRAPEGDTNIQAALGTAFTYQGRLTDGGSPANGAYDFEFALCDAASGGTTLGTLTVGNATVTDGMFTVQLNFGAEGFTGDARWLQIGVRPGDSSGAYTALTPRQALTAAPYALYAQQVAEHDHLGQTWTGSDNPLVVSGSFGGPDYAPLALSNSHTSGDGLRVDSAGDDGVHVNSADDNGVYVLSAANDGVSVYHAGNPSTERSSNGHDGIEVQGAEGDGVYVGQADVHGVRVYSAGEDGVHVWSAGEDGVHVESAGGYAGYFGGDVHVTGAATGFFPRPGWNSGWVSVSQAEVKTLTHNVGGDPDDYFVDMQCRSPTWGITNHGIGGDAQSALTEYGASYSALTSSSVKVYRRDDDVHCSEVRIRIWLIN